MSNIKKSCLCLCCIRC